MARDLKFLIYEVEELYYLCSKNEILQIYVKLVLTRIVFLQKKTDVSPLFVVRNIKMSLNEISNSNNGQLSANNPVQSSKNNLAML